MGRARDIQHTRSESQASMALGLSASASVLHARLLTDIRRVPVFQSYRFGHLQIELVFEESPPRSSSMDETNLVQHGPKVFSPQECGRPSALRWCKNGPKCKSSEAGIGTITASSLSLGFAVLLILFHVGFFTSPRYFHSASRQSFMK